MRITVCAVGRLRRGPELDLVNDYLKRFDRTGAGQGLGPARVIEVEDRKGGGSQTEAALLTKAVPRGAVTCLLDERGTVERSEAFAQRLARWRDAGTPEVTFLIGGADGHPPSLHNEADHLMSFGKMVWPHMLARVMLTEQLYRAAAILAGTPYHRA